MTPTDEGAPVNETARSLILLPAKAKFRRRTALAAQRKAIGWTQENLAAAVGVKPNTISRWECGRTTPPAWVRDNLALALQADGSRA